MNLLANLLQVLNVLAETANTIGDKGMAYIAVGMCGLSMMASGLGEGYVCACTVNSMARNPEMYSKLRTAMILGCALTETTAIYCLLLSIFLIFLG